MKKRLLCLFLGVILLLSCVLTGCDQENKEADVDGDMGAKTITMTVITEKKVCNTDKELADYLSKECGGDKNSDKYKEMLKTMETYEAVEAAFSKITKKKKTNVDLLFYTEEEYYDMLEVSMDEYALEKKNAEMAARALDHYVREFRTVYPEYSKEAIAKSFYEHFPEYEKYKNFSSEGGSAQEQYQKNEFGINELVYPKAEENQLDIIYLSGRDMYYNYIENEWIISLNEHLTTTGGKLNDYITPALMNGVKVDGQTFAIPNNVQMGEYTYMLVDKKLADQYKYTYESFENLLDCRYFLQDVATNESEILPIDSTFEDCIDLFVWYWNIDVIEDPELGMLNYTVNTDNKFSLLGTVYKDPSKVGRGEINLGWNNLFADAQYRDILTCLKGYELNGYYNNGSDNRQAAISFMNGTYSVQKQFKANGGVYTDESGKEYYAYVAKYPMADEYAMYGNMFAISANTKYAEACMEVITLLNTDPAARNILQYGIENVNYVIDEDTGVLHRLNNSYMMDIVKTGNCYIAYPEEGLPRDYWEDAKVQSNETLIDPLLGFDINGRLAEYGYRLDKEQLDWVAQWGQKKLADIENCDNYDDLCAMVENLGGAMNSDMIEILIINAKGEEQEAIINMGKLTNKAYDTATGADGEEDPNGESPYTIYYNWLVEFGYLAPEIAE